jgi:hypothetical protein
MNPALKFYTHILKDNDHPDRFKVAKDILDRNKLLGDGDALGEPDGNHLTVNTQLNTNVAAVSDPDFVA